MLTIRVDRDKPEERYFTKQRSVVAIQAVKRALNYWSVRFYLGVIVIFKK
jgi:hypothetical protein